MLIRRKHYIGLITALLLLNLLGIIILWQPASVVASTYTPSQIIASNASVPKSSGNVAYVANVDTDIDAATFLTARGYTVTVVPLANVLSTNFAPFDLIVIGYNTGLLDQWGTSPGEVAAILSPNKPILGMGEGGYAFFGKMSLFIGWPFGWHGQENTISKTLAAPAVIFNTPNLVTSNPIIVFTQTVQDAAIYLTSPVLSNTLVIGLEAPFPSYDHANLIGQGCRFLWGFSGSPYLMTLDGQNLFHNMTDYAMGSTCGPPMPLPTEQCLRINKDVNPPNLTAVNPGASIVYTLTVLNSNASGVCPNTTAILADHIPTGTVVYASGLGGGTQTQDNGIVWSIAPSSTYQSRTFTATVSLMACLNNGLIYNQARLGIPNAPSLQSNSIHHMLSNCPVVIYQLFLPLVQR